MPKTLPQSFLDQPISITATTIAEGLVQEVYKLPISLSYHNSKFILKLTFNFHHLKDSDNHQTNLSAHTIQDFVQEKLC